MENNSFEYTYSAQRQQEVEAIRKKYLPKDEDKMDKLRRLHSIPTQKAKAASIALGITGTLVLGTGMSLILTELGSALGYPAIILGIPIGLAGLVLIALAYPVYTKVLQTERHKIAPQILQLSEDLLK